MADRRQRQQSVSRQQYYSDRQAYIYGNAARQPEVLPRTKKKVRVRKPQHTSRQVRQNRNRAFNMDFAYVAFLAAAAICMMIVCIHFLQIQSEIKTRTDKISTLQLELTSLKEENDTAYNVVVDSINIEDIRNKAMNEMGMVYAVNGQVISYDSPTSDYVTQYADIPESGVLAQSDEAEK
ncbi:MAG: hypothetical protein PHN80_07470 [Hespellia sp.]|nr:hypothetical protein [Hespellia sp.]